MLSIEKSFGAGASKTQTLAGTNTYSGATTVYGGTLRFAGHGSTLNTSAITIRHTGTLLLDNSDTPLVTRIAPAAPITLQGGDPEEG